MDAKQPQKHTLKIDIMHIIIAIIVIVAAIYVVYKFTNKSGQVPDDKYWTEPFPFGTDPALHWHAYPKFSLCGEDKTLLQVIDMAGVKFPPSGEIGPMALHVHIDEPWIHIESPPTSRKSITLGAFFKGINIKFSNAGILSYDKPDSCNNGKANSLKVSVNGKQTEDSENLVLQEGQKILIEYD